MAIRTKHWLNPHGYTGNSGDNVFVFIFIFIFVFVFTEHTQHMSSLMSKQTVLVVPISGQAPAG